MPIYDRQRGTYIEVSQPASGALRFLYDTRLGRLLLRHIIVQPGISRYYARRMQKPRSRRQIPPFVERYGIDMDDYVETEYRSFADFFEREFRPGARPVAPPPALVAPADSCLLVYAIAPEGLLRIKGLDYTIAELLCDEALARRFHGGLCLVYRLAVHDGHHYIQIDDGRQTEPRPIPGVLHTVSRFSERMRVLAENRREYVVQQLEGIGESVYMEVGATLVGAIHNHPQTDFVRGEVKGHFSYGGSTIVQLFTPGAVHIADDILEQTRAGIESRVRQGEAVGEVL